MSRRRGRFSWHRWAQVILLPCLLLLVKGVGRVAPRATIVSLTFDDGNEDQLQAVPMLARRGLNATFYIISDRVGNAGALSRSDLNGLRSAGHEIGGHTLTHPRLTALAEPEQRREICEDRARLRGWGFEADHFAYPFGAFDSEVADVVRSCGYSSARAVGNLEGAGPHPPSRPYSIPAPSSVQETDTLQDLQKLVLDAERTGGWLLFTFHHVCESCGQYGIKAAVLEDFIDWLSVRNGKRLS
ncbi:MAG: polysaccharide deacetylase family protein, partial [Elusimicrobia bacterium]|nr:polysaccharide deacetylase family protein [Elusimicrobiota bacterium]